MFIIIYKYAVYVTSHPALALADSLPKTLHGAGGSKRRRRALKPHNSRKGNKGQQEIEQNEEEQSKKEPKAPGGAKGEKKTQKGKGAKEKG